MIGAVWFERPLPLATAGSHTMSSVSFLCVVPNGQAQGQDWQPVFAKPSPASLVPPRRFSVVWGCTRNVVVGRAFAQNATHMAIFFRAHPTRTHILGNLFPEHEMCICILYE